MRLGTGRGRKTQAGARGPRELGCDCEGSQEPCSSCGRNGAGLRASGGHNAHSGVHTGGCRINQT